MMHAGPELDALVAEHVMKGTGNYGEFLCPNCGSYKFGSSSSDGGRTLVRHCKRCKSTFADDSACFRALPYSTDIAAAWLVMEKLCARYSNLSLHAANGWGLSCGRIDVNFESEERELIEQWTAPINADTAELVICLAALQSVGVAV